MQRPNPSSATVTTSAGGLHDEIRAGDPEVDDAVLDVLGDVARADEQQVDRRVRARDDERPLRHLEGQPGIGAQSERGLASRPFDGTASVSRPSSPTRLRDAPSPRRLSLDPSSAVAYPPVPCRSHCATRVTVAVEVGTRPAISTYETPWSRRSTVCQRCVSASSSGNVHRSRRKRRASSRVRRREHGGGQLVEPRELVGGLLGLLAVHRPLVPSC